MDLSRGPVWYRLRESRAQPPGRAAKDARRRRLYAAALQQFEEMMEAAGVVGPATRPLQLYYALSQAGRAVAAAHGGQWNLHGHGLRVRQVEPGLLATEVEPAGDGEFQTVAALTGSPALGAAAELGALWASLPEVAHLVDEERWPVALRVWPLMYGATSHQKLSRGLETVVVFEPLPQSREQLADVLSRYPSSGTDWTLLHPPGVPGLATQVSPAGFGLPLRWGDAETNPWRKLETVAPEYRFDKEHWLRPAIGADALSPLATWWALLFALSIIARYHPAEWAAALRVDASELAAPLEVLLDEALTAIPHLVLEALRGEEVIFRRGHGPA